MNYLLTAAALAVLVCRLLLSLVLSPSVSVQLGSQHANPTRASASAWGVVQSIFIDHIGGFLFGISSSKDTPVSSEEPPTHVPTPPDENDKRGVTNAFRCPTISSYQYSTISIVPGTYPSGDPVPKTHPDLNTIIRGAVPVSEDLSVIEESIPFQALSPQIPTMFDQNKEVIEIVATYSMNDWKWDHTLLPMHGMRGTPIQDPPVSIISLASVPGETLYPPFSEEFVKDIAESTRNDPYQALVLYADTQRLVLKYSASDSILGGYVVYIEGICVDPSLLGLYSRKIFNDPARRDTLVALRARYNPITRAPSVGNPIGAALGDEVKVAIRDEYGTFLDPRRAVFWQEP